MNRTIGVPSPDEAVTARARDRQNQLTKPPGSLGRLEELAVRLAALQGRERPTVDDVRIVVFAGDHGVTAEGVSAFPQSVTVEMIRNFARGGAAISVMARELGASLEVVNLGTAEPHEDLPGVRAANLSPGTANFASQPAMDEATLAAALEEGAGAVERAVDQGAELFVGGEMGIGNTAAATAVACSLLDAPVTELVGPGTGLDTAGVGRKALVIERALDRHGRLPNDPEEALRTVGGLELAALAGAYTTAAVHRVPVLVDGFIATVAALAAVRRTPSLRPWLLFAHGSAEPGHARVLEALDAEPLLSLGMRLGEGSGAAVAVPLLRAACALHNGMATFAEAGVSEGDG